MTSRPRASSDSPTAGSARSASVSSRETSRKSPSPLRHRRPGPGGAPCGATRAQLSRPYQGDNRTGGSTPPPRPVGDRLGQRGDLFVGLHRCFGEVPRPMLGPLDRRLWQSDVRSAALVPRREPHDPGANERVSEHEPMRGFVDLHQPGLLRRAKSQQFGVPGGGSQDAELAAAVQHCEQQQRSGRDRQVGDAGGEQVLDATVRGSNRGGVGCAIPRHPFNARANSSRANGLRSASASRRVRTRGASIGNRSCNKSLAAASSNGPNSWVGAAPPSKKVCTSEGVAARNPTRLTERRRATKLSTSVVERSSHCRSSTTTRTGHASAACSSGPSAAFRRHQPAPRRAVALAEAERRGQRLAVQFVESIKLADQGHQQLVQPGEGHVGFELDPPRPAGPECRPPSPRRQRGSAAPSCPFPAPRRSPARCQRAQPDRGTTRSAPTPRLARAGPHECCRTNHHGCSTRRPPGMGARTRAQ